MATGVNSRFDRNASVGNSVKPTLASRWRAEAVARVGGQERLPRVQMIGNTVLSQKYQRPDRLILSMIASWLLIAVRCFVFWLFWKVYTSKDASFAINMELLHLLGKSMSMSFGAYLMNPSSWMIWALLHFYRMIGSKTTFEAIVNSSKIQSIMSLD